MTLSRLFIEQTGDIKPDKASLPTMYDLPSEDPEEPGLPDEFHDLQPQRLSATLRLMNVQSDHFFTGTDPNAVLKSVMLSLICNPSTTNNSL